MIGTTTRKRLLLIGGTQRAVPTLTSLLTRKDVEYVQGIFMRGHADEHRFARQLADLGDWYGLPYTVEDKVSPASLARVAQASCDALIGIGVWRTHLPDAFLQAAKYGFLGIHGTPLPQYRGFAGIYWQIINGDSSVGLRGLQLASGIDDGPIICDGDGRPVEGQVALDNEWHLTEILAAYDKCHIQLVNRVVDLVRDDQIHFTPQNSAGATYSCHRGPDDGEINWTDSTRNVFNFIRAQTRPLSGAYTFFQNRKVWIWRSRPRPDFANYEGRICGKVVHRDLSTGSVVVLTRDGGIEIVEASALPTGTQEVQRPSEIFSTVRARCTTEVEAFVRQQRDDGA